MDNRIGSRFKNVGTNLINHKETNFVLTSLLGFFTVYINLVAIFNRNIIHPFTFSNDLHHNAKNESKHNASLGMQEIKLNETNNTNVHWLESESDGTTQFLVQTIFSLFILWFCALTLGRVSNYLFLPSLLGMLINGLIFANLSWLTGILMIHRSWDVVIRQIAFVLCLIRCGIGIDAQTLKRSWVICLNFGILTATVEVIAIVLISYFNFLMSLEIAFIFAYVLAASSPAVTVPTMLDLELQGRGTDRGIPSAMLTSVSIDNIYCITAFTILNSTIFDKNFNDLAYKLTLIPVQLLMGSLFGVLAGIVLRVLPRYDAHFSHFTRAALLFTSSCAFLFGTSAINCSIAGPIAILIMCIVASKRWKIDNHKMNCLEEKAFKIIWDLLFLPLLFALIGLIFNLSILSWTLFWNALAVIGVGLFARVLSSFLVSLCTNLNMKERFFLSFCLTPKATVQAVLLPFLLRDCSINCDHDFITLCCLLAILITAPLGQMMIQLLGTVCLSQRKVDGVLLSNKKISSPIQARNFLSYSKPNNNSNVVYPFKNVEPIKKINSAMSVPQFTTSLPLFKNQTNYKLSDQDNRLRLEVGPNINTQPPIAAKRSLNKTEFDLSPPLPKTLPPPLTTETDAKSPFTFEEINQQAYEVFKRQTLARMREGETDGAKKTINDYHQFLEPIKRRQINGYSGSNQFEKL